MPRKTTGHSSRQGIRRRVFDIIQIGKLNDIPSRAFDIFIVLTILTNITLMFLETFDAMEPYMDIIGTVEAITVAVFCVEYILRIWTADFLFPELSRPKAALRFIVSFDGIVDLLTILPFFFLSGFVVFRMLRVVRIFHLFRINATYDSFHVIKSVLYEKRNQLASSIFIILVLMLASSLCMYSAEHEVQPENCRNAFSGIWWSVSTLVTVGYGDIYPITSAGRALAIIISFLGVGTVAIPTGIISAGFVEQYTELQYGQATRDVNLQTVVIDMDSGWIGKTPAQVLEEYHIAIVLARRGDATFITGQSEGYLIRMGDALVVYRQS